MGADIANNVNNNGGLIIPPVPPVPANPRCGCCDKVTSCVGGAIRNVADFFAYAVGKSDNLQPVCKFTKSAISTTNLILENIVQPHLGHLEVIKGLGNLKAVVDTTDTFLDPVDLVLDLVGYLPKQEFRKVEGEVKEVNVWFFEGVTPWKIVSKLVGTVSKILGLVKFIFELGLINLGKIAAYVLIPLRIIKDSLTAISAGFDVAHHGVSIAKKLEWSKSDECKIYTAKRDKWKAKDELRHFYTLRTDDAEKAFLDAKIKDEEVGVGETKLDKYMTDLRQRYLTARTELANLGVVARRENPPTPEDKWVDTDDRYARGIVPDLKEKCFERIELRDKKIRDNSGVSITKNILAIIFQVAKIAAILIGLVGVAFAAIAGTLPFIVTLTVAWLITGTVGMVRMGYGFRHQNVN
jgi:hypothetical protein